MTRGQSTLAAGGRPPAVQQRAQDGARQYLRESAQRVEIGSRWITIRRDISGIAAQVNVPTQSYQGVALRAPRDGRPFELALRHMDASLDVLIARTEDDSELIALWRGYGRMLSLPLLAEDPLGRLLSMEARGAESPFGRRRGSPLKSRRPRFLARRKIGVPQDAAALT